jgi:hypothetical protein
MTSRSKAYYDSHPNAKKKKLEYDKKYQKRPGQSKYRSELNKYNRERGTYGNGDGKDATHKGGKIVGFEGQSKNRARKTGFKRKLRSVINKMRSRSASASKTK